MPIGEVEINLCGRKPVMAEYLLDCGKRDAFLDGKRCECVTENVRGDILRDFGLIGHLLHNLLSLPRPYWELIVESKERFEDGPHP